MPTGSFGLGVAQAFANYLTQERQRRRSQEDSELDRQMQLIHTLVSQPNVDPTMLGTAIHDLANLGAARGRPRGAARGGAGFLGSSDPSQLPISQLLAQISTGAIPPVGELASPLVGAGAPQTIGAVQQPSALQQPPLPPPPGPPAAALGPPPGAPPGPPSAPPEPLPPAGLTAGPGSERIMDAGRDMQKDQGAPAIVPGGLPPPPTIARHGLFLPPMYGMQMDISRKAQEDYWAKRSGLAGTLAAFEGAGGTLNPAERSMFLKHQLGIPIGRQNIEWVDDPQDETSQIGYWRDPISQELTPTVDPTIGAAIRRRKPQYAGIIPEIGPMGAVTGLSRATGETAWRTGPGVGKPQIPPVTLIQSGHDAEGNPKFGSFDRRTKTIAPVDVKGDILPGPPIRLNAQGESALTGVLMVKQMAMRVLDIIARLPDPESNNPLPMKFDLWLYRYGIRPDELTAQLFQVAGAAEAYGLRALLGGFRNMQMVQLLQNHLFRPGISPKQMAGLARELRDEILPRAERTIYEVAQRGMRVPEPEQLPHAPGSNPAGLTLPPR